MRTAITPQFVEFVPENLAEGVLYISLRFNTAVHKCCCGCGQEVVTPLGPSDWSIRQVGQKITLHPSVGNWSFPCQSHYLIQRNQVVWVRTFNAKEIELVRRQDQRDKKAYIETVNRQKEARSSRPPQNRNQDHQSTSIIRALWEGLSKLW